MTLWLLLKHITESCLLLYDQHFHHLRQISPWTADSRHHFHSECVRLMFHEHPLHRCAHWAHLRDLWETLPLPSILYSRLNLLPLAAFQGSQANIVGGKPVHFASSSQLADWQKAARYSSSPYSLFRSQHKSPGKTETIILATNKENSSTIIYIRFARLKSSVFLTMQCYAEADSLVLSHFLSCWACIRSFFPHLWVVSCSCQIIDGDLSSINSNKLSYNHSFHILRQREFF